MNQASPPQLSKQLFSIAQELSNLSAFSVDIKALTAGMANSHHLQPSNGNSTTDHSKEQQSLPIASFVVHKAYGCTVHKPRSQGGLSGGFR
jgi:hypothetical protein